MLIYRLALSLYRILIVSASPFNEKARHFIHGRRNLFKKLQDDLGGLEGFRVWIHVASAGELEQARPVIEQLRQRFPVMRLVVSVFSPSAYGPAQKLMSGHLVYNLPLDSKLTARKWLELVRPGLIVIGKTEVWYYYLLEALNRRIPVVYFSSRFRAKQLYFGVCGRSFRRALRQVNHFFVQDQASAEVLRKHGISQITVSGDTRFDRVTELVSKPPAYEWAREFKGNKRLLIVGSSWKQDIRRIAPFINEIASTVKVIIVPHEPHKNQVTFIRRKMGGSILSEIEHSDLNNLQILIVDRAGLLSSLYQYADFALVGGAFGRGLHNILEPAAYGIPVFYGKADKEKFPEAWELNRAGGGFVFQNHEELSRTFELLNRDPAVYEKACRDAANFVKQSRGATKLVMDYLERLLKN